MVFIPFDYKTRNKFTPEQRKFLRSHSQALLNTVLGDIIPTGRSFIERANVLM